MTPDVNVLVAAYRADHPHHTTARTWLEQALTQAASGATFSVMPMVTASFLRLVTSPKIFQQPTPIDDAVAFIDALLAAPGVRQSLAGAEWPHLGSLCVERQLSGNDLPDAWLAACVMHHGEHLVTFDRDFRKLLPRGQLTILAVEP
jgi:toxin-antitoxin system PIN domain toxin